MKPPHFVQAGRWLFACLQGIYVNTQDKSTTRMLGSKRQTDTEYSWNIKSENYSKLQTVSSTVKDTTTAISCNQLIPSTFVVWCHKLTKGCWTLIHGATCIIHNISSVRILKLLFWAIIVCDLNHSVYINLLILAHRHHFSEPFTLVTYQSVWKYTPTMLVNSEQDNAQMWLEMFLIYRLLPLVIHMSSVHSSLIICSKSVCYPLMGPWLRVFVRI